MASVEEYFVWELRVKNEVRCRPLLRNNAILPKLNCTDSEEISE